jgi:hypothetical protein
MAKEQILTIDGKQYKPSDLSEDARNQLMGLRLTDQELGRLKNQQAILQTARIAYGKALQDALGISGKIENTAEDEDLTFTFS